MKAARPVVLKRHFLFTSVLFSILSLIHCEDTSAYEGAIDRYHTSCVFCHRMPASEISADHLFPEGVDPSSICLDCHHYSENHHPVNFVPEKAFDGTDASDFPLFDGEIRCLTCHRVHRDDGLEGRPLFLRGGPYTYRTEICFLCHDKDLNRRVNPHRMREDSGEIREIGGQPICLMCHAAVPDQTSSPVKVAFKADVAFLCWRCHPPMANDEFFRGHFLVKPRRLTLARMKRVEQEYDVSFPLLNRDRVTCSTCHNPHQKGIIVDGPARAGEDAPFRLRMPSGTICYGCHDM